MIKDFFIKNMVCDRCIRVLTSELRQQKIPLLEIELGRLRVEMAQVEHQKELENILEENGFSFIDTPEQKLAEQVKIELIKLIRILPLKLNRKLSVYLEEKLNHEYSKISKVFSFTEHVTIEKYFIKLKIEKVKELIQTNEYNFTQIAQLLDYSHINHLSGQFKNDTGMSLTDYKNNSENFRNPLDQIV